MVQIVGKYQYVSSENFEEFVKTMGMTEMAMPLMGSKPTVEISKNGDQWTIVVVAEDRTSTTTFKLNEPYDEKLPSYDRKFKSLTVQEGENFKTETTIKDNITIVRRYEFTDTGMKVHLSTNMNDAKAVRTYKRI
ncbi:FABP-like protein [Calliopsis andreniformis]|uniref:FABP-like protein n=1 Tax=Calliopsis andreniformis TaxID=337506 RepID=UPI003FCE9263